MKILLHVCCAPCSTEVIERLKDEYEVTLFFFNPNIQPQEEYQKRLSDARLIAERTGLELIEGRYEPERWNDQVKGHENEPEGGERCNICYRMRLQETAKNAEGFDIIGTTLTISPYKDADKINSIGREIGIPFLESNFKKKDGYRKSIEHSRMHGLYRQDYCGCLYSKAERMNHIPEQNK